ncbi:MAG TPA: serine hydrolase domain-containing protein, partial [Atribacterota bacterium]|nr:serine hydrolase domain-containing protein [Atribacterota bacterium]
NTLVIGSEGLNEWLMVEFDTILSFEMPDKGRVIIFSSEGIIYDSLVDSGDISVPEGCLLEVAGEPGAQFQITASVDETAKISKSAAKISEILMADYGVNSLQYTLLSGNKIIISGSADKHGGGEAVSPDVDTNSTIYGIGSTSKMFTAVAVMLLSEQGKINLDKPVIDYVPDFVMKDERYKDITVRMLLNHSSGLMGSTYTNGVLFDDNSTFNHDHLLSALANQKLKAEPGAYSVYCNDGFSLAEIVVERVSGLTFSEFVRENITGPLGLENTFTSQDVFDRELMAKTFIRDNETPPEMVNMIGSGGLYSTALELCLFGQIFMNNPENEIAKDFLSPASKDAMNEKEYLKGMWPEQTDNFFNYGLGWDSVELYPFNHYGIKGIAKGGDTQLYHSSLIVLPEQNMSFAVVMSGGSSIFGELMGLSLLQQVLLSEGEIDAIISAHEDISEAVPMPVELTHYAGLYENNTMVTEIKIEQNGTLTMSVVAELTGQNVPEESFIYYSSGKFVSEDKSKKISFVQEANGETYLHMIKNISLPGVGEIIMTSYDSVKISPNQVGLDIQQVWDERSGVYYLVNEMRSGEMYYNLFQSIFEISTSKELPGYLGTYRIDDKNTASQRAQIPVMNGRDNTSIHYSIDENGKEYLSDGSWIYLSGKGISEIYAGVDAICTIPESGYAQWYFVGKEEEGKTMTVKLPDEGAFAVYDSSECIYYSTVSDNQPVMLPAEGKIVFIGDNPGTKFYITIK